MCASFQYLCTCSQVKELREKFDSTSESLTETRSQLRESEERGREREEECERVKKELEETSSRAEELKVWLRGREGRKGERERERVIE